MTGPETVSPQLSETLPNLSAHSKELLAEQLKRVNEQLNQYTQSPRLLAVSKQQSADTLRQAFLLGQEAFGENYLQEALNKMQSLQDLSIEWHFIGPIQSNKCKAIAENFSWIQSLDRIKVAKKLNDFCPKNKTLQVCVQVNIDREPTKSGVSIQDLGDFCLKIADFKSLKLRGIMAIPKAGKGISEQSESFARLSQQFSHLKETHPELDTLSIGMSKDYLIALKEGATLIRLGSQLFGERKARV